jgi:ribosomal-protein-serine acetyltransferase
LHIQISEQIKLFPLLESDALEILKLVNSSRVDLGKFLYWVKNVKCIDSAKKYISERVNSGLNGSRWFKVYFNGSISGIFAIKSVCSDSFVAEVGYWLSSATQGNGVTNQIIHKLPEIMSGTGAKSVEFRCLEQNHASINIALKSGAKLVSSIPNFMVANEFMQNLNIYRVQL